MSDYSENFTPYVAVPAEGIRIALATCKRCGTAVVWSAHDTIDILALHDAWHAEIKGLIDAPRSPRTTLPDGIDPHKPTAVCP